MWAGWTSQKGMDLVHHALFHTLADGGQFVLLGTEPDPAINDTSGNSSTS